MDVWVTFFNVIKYFIAFVVICNLNFYRKLSLLKMFLNLKVIHESGHELYLENFLEIKSFYQILIFQTILNFSMFSKNFIYIYLDVFGGS